MIVIEGVGLHTGQPVKLTIKPAPDKAGIVFFRDGQAVPAKIDQLRSTDRGTCLNGLATVEHFLAAAYGLGVYDLLVDVEGEELPALDGSAIPFAEVLLKAGLAKALKSAVFLEIDRPIIVEEERAFIKAAPYHGFKVNFVINFKGIGEQSFSIELTKDSFLREIAPARTFGYLEEHEMLKKRGLALGASAENALILGKTGYVNQPRFKDEPVRHKILDLIGDLALLGCPLHAEITAFASGHKLNTELVRRILNG